MMETKPLLKQGWMRALLFAITFLLLIILSNILTDRLTTDVAGANKETNNFSGEYLLIKVSISLIISVLSVYFFRKLVDRQNLVSLGLQLKNNFHHAAVGFFLGLLLLGMGSFVLIASHNLNWTGINFDPVQLLTGLGVMLIVAFGEELVFRGYILHNLMLSVNKWMALVYSALLFALFHLNNPGITVVALLNVFIAALLLGINYIFTKNLWFGILFHFTWNFYQGSILGYKVSGVSLKSLFEQQLTGHYLLTGGSFGFEGSIVAGVLSLLALLLLAWVYKRRFEEKL